MTILTIYMIPEFIIGIIFSLFGIGMIYIMTKLNSDKIDCAVIVLVCFIGAIGFILGSTQRPSPTKQDVIDGTAVYVSDTVVGNGKKVVFYDIVWKDNLPDNYDFEEYGEALEADINECLETILKEDGK